MTDFISHRRKITDKKSNFDEKLVLKNPNSKKLF